ncbi:MAG: Asp23/Gls24 family envelope stress response protein [Oscillospiraceae bacterium]|nr:Asp23/Gls24 family envelope stress response protein [Oscillospiraceae bacterium]
MKIENESGVISITSDVFMNLAGDAASRCFGVKGMAGRAKGDGIAVLLRRESMSKGVAVRFPETGGVDIELHIVVDHGLNVSTLARSIISEVSYKVAEATGVPVNRVDVFVDSMLMD